MNIFVTMGIKTGMAFLFIALFLMARVQPAMPSFKALSGATHQLISHDLPFFACSDQHGSDQDTGDDVNDDKDNADKDIEKDFSKSFIDYHNIMPDNHMAAIYESNAVKALFHHYRPGKVRDHVNEVFRPPLV
ncbi:hypothetical protein BEL04_17215 [Mucilaginibacter sp. PPCGB 2223]|uniref:hypothetical protein n=1 Tax=Mucilaginibacter sp. PPCGB 2223 TaxID=1886027 RepID=UPI0008253396|nr:hypothetical protein [Mucilaginibacter sp. PPCGB 2223]OCX51752.1 hypothetical protein BEL04_17215 [Mucilaginibacter sp. PPCGB 2223]